MATIYMAEDSRRPSLRVQLVDADGPVDVTGASSISFIMSKDGVAKVNNSANVTQEVGALGIVRYDWVAADVDTPGDYVARWLVTWSTGVTQEFPSSRYDRVVISPSAAGG